jgi:hypothetical protein
MRFGQYPVILQQLAMLPFQYFSDPVYGKKFITHVTFRLMDVLFPTLIVAALNDESNFLIIKKELSPSLLSTYIRSASSAPTADASTSDVLALRAPLRNRLPESRWQEALLWLQQ